MSVLVVGIVVGLVVVAYVGYQLVKSGKAVTVSNVVAQAKNDGTAVNSAVKKS